MCCTGVTLCDVHIITRKKCLWPVGGFVPGAMMSYAISESWLDKLRGELCVFGSSVSKYWIFHVLWLVRDRNVTH